jgi:predicted outer membrane repeat protein
MNNNIAQSGSGGAIYTHPECSLTILGKETSITNNEATQAGGILSRGSSTMINGVISGNTSTEASGGGIKVHAGSFVINGVTIENNTAQTNGGGIDAVADDGRLTLIDCVIRNNNATLQGNDVYPDDILDKMIIKGDLNFDKIIDIIDVILLLQEYINTNGEWTEDELLLEDMDLNELVDIIDVRLLLQKYINS